MASVYLTELRRLPETRAVHLTFSDGVTAELGYDLLRGYCPCAGCQGHWAEAVRYQRPAQPVEPANITPVGNYAVSFHWSDGHATGIYRFDFLRKIVDQTAAGEAPDRVRMEEHTP